MQPTTCPPTSDPDGTPAEARVVAAARLTAGATATAARARRRVNPATLNRISESAAAAAVEAFYHPAPRDG